VIAVYVRTDVSAFSIQSCDDPAKRFDFLDYVFVITCNYEGCIFLFSIDLVIRHTRVTRVILLDNSSSETIYDTCLRQKTHTLLSLVHQSTTIRAQTRHPPSTSEKASSISLTAKLYGARHRGRNSATR